MSRTPEPFIVHARPGRPGEWEITLRPATGLPPDVCSAWSRRSLRAAPPEFLASVAWPKTAPAARRAVQALIEYLRPRKAMPTTIGTKLGPYVELFGDATKSPRARRLEAAGRPYSAGTIELYRDTIARHILADKALADLSMERVTRAELEAYFVRLSRSLGGPCRTLQLAWAILRLAFRQFAADHPGALDPFDGMPKPVYEKEERGALSEAELVAMFGKEGVFSSALERAVCALAFWAGLRRGEIFALRWEDIDFERRRLTVRRAWQRFGSAKAVEGPTKSKKPRVVPLSAYVVDALGALKKEYGIHERVCSRRDGTLPSAGWWDDHIQGVLDRAGIDRKARGITPHSARHSLASALEARGVVPRHIKEMLGHSSERTTAGYLHTSEEAIEAAAKALE